MEKIWKREASEECSRHKSSDALEQRKATENRIELRTRESQ